MPLFLLYSHSLVRLFAQTVTIRRSMNLSNRIQRSLLLLMCHLSLLRPSLRSIVQVSCPLSLPQAVSLPLLLLLHQCSPLLHWPSLTQPSLYHSIKTNTHHNNPEDNLTYILIFYCLFCFLFSNIFSFVHFHYKKHYSSHFFVLFRG